MTERLIHPLGPVCDARTHTLILGSFPSVASMQARQYYAHPRNQFWRLLGAVIGQPLAELDYEQRVRAALNSGFGIWDVIGACERPGSLDSAIRNAQVNDFAGLLARHPHIQRLALNGGKAGQYRRLLAPFGKAMVVLPSSSPANATHSFDYKRSAWSRLLADCH
jgi:hypoxanthine-DNA glycosylase